MANPMATSSPAKPAATKSPAQALIPFTRGAKPHAEPFFDTTFTLGATSVNVGPVDVASYGFARAILLDVQLASSGNTATVALSEDAPWNVFAEIVFQDVNGAPILGPLAGYEAYLTHKYGGYRNQTDPKLLNVFVSPTTGAGATAGSGRFVLRLPLEINGRDALGSLANMNASQAYKVRATLNPLATIFTTTPSGTVTARVKMTLEAWSQPNAVDMMGRPQATVPPANQTTQFWSRFQPPTVSGANTIKHTRVGNFVRNLIYINRRAGTSRANGESDLAGLNIQWFVDSRLLTNLDINYIRVMMTEGYDLISTTFESAGGLDNGVFICPAFCNEFDGKFGYELRDGYLPTTQATRLEQVVTLPNSGVMTVMTNDVAPRGEIFL